jgi:organic radical activating enzyme
MNPTYEERLLKKNEHLLNKEVHVFITNVCNLSCGGCHQMCGNIPKEKLFFTPLDDIEWMINHLIENSLIKKKICIFGGEPTLHPKFDQLLEVIASKPCEFAVFTNGRLAKHKDREEQYLVDKDSKTSNLIYYVDKKDDTNRRFVQTWNSPKDYYKVEDNSWYFKELAKKNCFMWNNCRSIVFNKHAYACVNFPTMDILTGENHGWEMVDGEDAFARTMEEIEEQAKHYCYRCGHCMDTINTQRIGDKTKVSRTNLDLKILGQNVEII